MKELEQFLQINWKEVFIAFVLIMVVVLFLYKLCKELLFDVLGIETKGMRRRKDEHNLLIKTAQELEELSKQREKDVEESNEHDRLIRENLTESVQEIKSMIKETQTSVEQMHDNRVHDREQSLAIQKQLSDSIKAVTEEAAGRDMKIEALMAGSMELLGEAIDQRYEKYIALHGIPSDQVEEFESIYHTYKRLGGNHGRDAKFKYVKEHLDIIPVVTKIMTEYEN